MKQAGWKVDNESILVGFQVINLGHKLAALSKAFSRSWKSPLFTSTLVFLEPSVSEVLGGQIVVQSALIYSGWLTCATGD